VTRVYLKEDAGTLRLTVQEDGRGFNPTEEKGLGILGMQERVMRLSGKMELDSRPGKGTILLVCLPLPPNLRSGDAAGGPHLQEISPFRTA
jgi:signal transduction histidine kinase